MTIKKILIANRGEIAIRIIRACKELKIKTVSIYTPIDKEAPHTLIADEAVCIGPNSSTSSYLNHDAILEAAKAFEVDAIHPGYGFLSENPKFVRKCTENNIIFIGPSAEIMEVMGDKIAARQTVSNMEVPVIEGTESSFDIDENEIASLEFPVLIKASAGGGGKGMRIVNDSKEMKKSIQESQNEANSAFGNSNVYIERYIKNARHVEIQVLADEYGNVIHLGERDCSIQRRHQKLIEETPCVFISDSMKKKLYNDAIKICKKTNYTNSGTIEFLVDMDREKHYFIEMNTRVQVEHPVSEMVTGVDIVKEQLKISNGEKLEIKQEEVKFSGHSIESRINSEDINNSFAPTPGTINQFIIPSGIGVRIDTYCYSGFTVPPFYDSLIGKVIVKAENRNAAINKLQAALRSMYVTGIKTTIPLHLSILEESDFIEGEFNTKWLEESLSNIIN